MLDKTTETPSAARIAANESSESLSGPFPVAENYDRYFASHLYDRRYPRPNPASLAVIVEQIRARGGRVLDFGCGNGRYAAPLLAQTEATIVAYDISREAIDELSARYPAQVADGRLRPVWGDLAALSRTTIAQGEPFDLAIMMFGVLGHIASRTQRRETLATIHQLLRPGGRLIVTVPNAARRFRRHQAEARPLMEKGVLEPGDIHYQRMAGQVMVKMYYHLYSLEEFGMELERQGFRLIQMGAESFLPESGVVRSPFLRGLDRLLAIFAPLRYAYGFLAVAETAPEANSPVDRSHGAG
ncbi:MAG TPA: class I SAM-dependent methyltransferase [Candidatus Competibacteraceae bacterium]|nr:class I SAM-dependent methyltransferase [Candidatus Competibacteraceae bacterium]HQD56106.1 class I SAM-dependent methyltransferase [Candidatus Competibacteraceae bacterium]